MTIFPCPLFPLAEHSRLGQHTLETSIWLSACVSIQAVCQMAGSRFKTSWPGLHRLRESYRVFCPREFTTVEYCDPLLGPCSLRRMVVLLTLRHYSRTCWKPEEVIDRKERQNLARVYVKLKSGSDLFQVGNGQAFFLLRQDSACRYDDAHSGRPTKSASAGPVCIP